MFKRVGEISPGSLGFKLPEELATGVWPLLAFGEGLGVGCLVEATANARTGFGRSAESSFERFGLCQGDIRNVAASY